MNDKYWRNSDMLNELKRDIYKYASEDIGEITHSIRTEYNENVKGSVVSVEQTSEADQEIRFAAKFIIQFGTRLKQQMPFTLKYVARPNEEYLDYDVWLDGERSQEEIAEDVANMLHSKAHVYTATRIVGADEDEQLMSKDAAFDDDVDLQDSLDELADNVEDMQDSIDDVVEDDVNIDVENNIVGHYIAECEKCHGIFISAMLESDQKVETISGTCPLCQKHSVQWLKWVIHEVGEVE